MIKRALFLAFGALLCLPLILCGCTQKDAEIPVSQSESEQKNYICAPADKVYSFNDNSPVFSLEDTFYPADILVELKTQTEADIYYTVDCSEPDKSDTLYTGEGIYFECENSDFPTAHTVKAKAFYSDGTESAVSVHTYFCAKSIDERFSTAVFSISGEPDALTNGPDGIFYGENYELRGDESEREVYLEAFDKNGSRIISQYCGVRIYGGVSRESSVKSMKLYARKSYSSGIGKFNIDIFETPVEDGSGDIVGEYDKLVLRNCGNDFQFAYIRDELCQMLAKDAGFTDYESVVPAVCYLNGEYYGFFWLHESYCDDYFKNKYPNENAGGDFEVIEGTDTKKNTAEDGGKEVYAEEYNEIYYTFSQADLTDDSVYSQLCEYIDVENYLDYFAFNIYINNKDWPCNNFRCYRYCGLDGEEFDGVYDGRWRFLLHDTDYSLGLYEQTEVMADYNNLEHILTPGDEKYSPLFDALMHREDCRKYFADKIGELAQGALSAEHINEKLGKMDGQRYFEQKYYYKYLEDLRNSGKSDIWTYSSHLSGYMDLIRNFANERAEYILKYTEEVLSAYDQTDETTE